ncbi:hypothetical protein FH972_026712 [Carpinus fangiana]|uniref:5'-3' DNA helicase ZGRF1-like N-terminal domain-containing protein n=1 Tax=Carpinus fangiana TaxID=176857 RepID=A0A5N6L4T6_9ROSI|nr:hypothetical protein FH972_026712 [Carpinus fangiana]
MAARREERMMLPEGNLDMLQLGHALEKQREEHNTAPVHEFHCTFSHDIKRKNAKRWKDGFLKFHTFNNRLLVYDESRNFVQAGYHVGPASGVCDGAEFPLDYILVEVGPPMGVTQTDLSEVVKKRSPKRPTPPRPGQVRLDSRPSTAQSNTSLRSLVASYPQSRVQSPYDRRLAHDHSADARPSKRARTDDNHKPLFEILRTTTSAAPRLVSKTQPSAAGQSAKAIHSRAPPNLHSSAGQSRLKIKETVDLTLIPSSIEETPSVAEGNAQTVVRPNSTMSSPIQPRTGRQWIRRLDANGKDMPIVPPPQSPSMLQQSAKPQQLGKLAEEASKVPAAMLSVSGRAAHHTHQVLRQAVEGTSPKNITGKDCNTSHNSRISGPKSANVRPPCDDSTLSRFPPESNSKESVRPPPQNRQRNPSGVTPDGSAQPDASTSPPKQNIRSLRLKSRGPKKMLCQAMEIFDMPPPPPKLQDLPSNGVSPEESSDGTMSKHKIDAPVVASVVERAKIPKVSHSEDVEISSEACQPVPALRQDYSRLDAQLLVRPIARNIHQENEELRAPNADESLEASVSAQRHSRPSTPTNPHAKSDSVSPRNVAVEPERPPHHHQKVTPVLKDVQNKVFVFPAPLVQPEARASLKRHHSDISPLKRTAALSNVRETPTLVGGNDLGTDAAAPVLTSRRRTPFRRHQTIGHAPIPVQQQQTSARPTNWAPGANIAPVEEKQSDKGPWTREAWDLFGWCPESKEEELGWKYLDAT